MPKMKTNKAASKRFTVTGSGRIKHKKKGLRHNLGHRSSKSKRKLGQAGYLGDTDHHLIARLLPYGN